MQCQGIKCAFLLWNHLYKIVLILFFRIAEKRKKRNKYLTVVNEVELGERKLKRSTENGSQNEDDDDDCHDNTKAATLINYTTGILFLLFFLLFVVRRRRGQ